MILSVHVADAVDDMILDCCEIKLRSCVYLYTHFCIILPIAYNLLLNLNSSLVQFYNWTRYRTYVTTPKEEEKTQQ